MKHRTNRQLTKDNARLRKEIRGNSERAELLHDSLILAKLRISMLKSAISRSRDNLYVTDTPVDKILKKALEEDRQYD